MTDSESGTGATSPGTRINAENTPPLPPVPLTPTQPVPVAEQPQPVVVEVEPLTHEEVQPDAGLMGVLTGQVTPESLIRAARTPPPEPEPGSTGGDGWPGGEWMDGGSDGDDGHGS